MEGALHATIFLGLCQAKCLHLTSSALSSECFRIQGGRTTEKTLNVVLSTREWIFEDP